MLRMPLGEASIACRIHLHIAIGPWEEIGQQSGRGRGLLSLFIHGGGMTGMGRLTVVMPTPHRNRNGLIILEIIPETTTITYGREVRRKLPHKPMHEVLQSPRAQAH